MQSLLAPKPMHVAPKRTRELAESRRIVSPPDAKRFFFHNSRLNGKPHDSVNGRLRFANFFIIFY